MQELLEPLVHAVTNALDSFGVWAVFILMILESACIPAPSEVIMLYAGYLVWSGDATFLAVVVAGVAGNVIGSWIAWGIGRYGGRTFLERHGRWLHVSPKHLAHADRWFEEYGPITVLVTRCLPIIRTFISLPAGVARMPLGTFTLYTLLGCIPWVVALAWIGVKMGPNWEKARDILHYGDYLFIAVVGVAGVWWLLRRRRRRVGALGAPVDSHDQPGD